MARATKKIYTAGEDEGMTRYIWKYSRKTVKDGICPQGIQGDNLWKEAASRQRPEKPIIPTWNQWPLTTHSWESMKEHVKKRIIPQWRTFERNYIPDAWQTGPGPNQQFLRARRGRDAGEEEEEEDEIEEVEGMEEQERREREERDRGRGGREPPQRASSPPAAAAVSPPRRSRGDDRSRSRSRPSPRHLKQSPPFRRGGQGGGSGEDEEEERGVKVERSPPLAAPVAAAAGGVGGTSARSRRSGQQRREEEEEEENHSPTVHLNVLLDRAHSPSPDLAAGLGETTEEEEEEDEAQGGTRQQRGRQQGGSRSAGSLRRSPAPAHAAAAAPTERRGPRGGRASDEEDDAEEWWGRQWCESAYTDELGAGMDTLSDCWAQAFLECCWDRFCKNERWFSLWNTPDELMSVKFFFYRAVNNKMEETHCYDETLREIGGGRLKIDWSGNGGKKFQRRWDLWDEDAAHREAWLEWGRKGRTEEEERLKRQQEQAGRHGGGGGR